MGKECSGTEVDSKSCRPPLSLKKSGINVKLFIFAFCKKDKITIITPPQLLHPHNVLWGCNNAQLGLQCWVCGSDIRQHAKLQGHPRQWNCRWLIDRLLERKQVQIASHFHAPTRRDLHQGEGEQHGRVRVCASVCSWERMLSRGVCKPTGEVDVTLTVICTCRRAISHKYICRHTHILTNLSL